MSASERIPGWAIINTALLVAPIILGFGLLFGMWFMPNPSIQIPSAVSVVLYYVVVIQICQRTSGTKLNVRRAYQGMPRTVWVWGALGLLGFSCLAFGGAYVTTAAWITSAIGHDVKKTFTVSAFYDPQLRRCDYKLVLKDAAPVIGRGFCVSSYDARAEWVKGSRVVLVGKESILGFRFTRIET